MKLLKSFPYFSFPHRIKWSPDGSQFIYVDYNRSLKVISSKSYSYIAEQSYPKNVTDIQWYPLMNESDPSSCAFACVLPFNPIQLIDSNDSHVRAQYHCYSKGDSPASLTSVCFHGSSLYSGSTKSLYECNILRSERIGKVIYKCKGSILSLHAHSYYSCILCGTTIGSLIIFDPRHCSPVCITNYHTHGIDSIAAHNNVVITSARLENNVCIYDIRNPQSILHSLKTSRISSRHVSVSSNDGYIGIGSESSPSYLYDENFNLLCRIGQDSTPFCELSPVAKSLISCAGDFQIVEEKNGETTFKPLLTNFCLYSFE